MVIHVDERKALLAVIDHLRWRTYPQRYFLQTSSAHMNFHFFFCLGQKVIERSVQTVSTTGKLLENYHQNKCVYGSNICFVQDDKFFQPNINT